MMVVDVQEVVEGDDVQKVVAAGEGEGCYTVVLPYRMTQKQDRNALVQADCTALACTLTLLVLMISRGV